VIVVLLNKVRLPLGRWDTHLKIMISTVAVVFFIDQEPISHFFVLATSAIFIIARAIFLETCIVLIIFCLDTALGKLEQNPSIVHVIDRVHAINELICCCLPARNFLLLNLIVFNNVPHKVLYHVPLPLL